MILIIKITEKSNHIAFITDNCSDSEAVSLIDKYKLSKFYLKNASAKTDLLHQEEIENSFFSIK